MLLICEGVKRMAATKADEERRKRELRNARSQKSYYERLKAAKEGICNENDQKIARLKSVKSNLEAQKFNAETQYNNWKQYSDNDANFADWYGDTCTKTRENLQNSLVSEYKGYVERIDEVLDAVCDEITHLQNENFMLNGDILGIVSTINSLLNKIRTLCN